MSKEIASARSRFESNENEFEDSSTTIPLPPPRTPLNSIPDPSQSLRSVEKRSDNAFPFDVHFVSRNGTPGVASKGKAIFETTPARRVSSIGASGARSSLKGCNLVSRVSRGISSVNSETSIEVPHFELVEDPSFWKDHNVQVLIRTRPLNDSEKSLQGFSRCLRQESSQSLVWLGQPETRFTFDHVACETISQEKLFRVAGLPMVENCMSGYNSCMFAYGQTGSGKTYTMMGEIVQINGKLNDHSGITPRIFEYLFNRIREEEEKQRSERLKFRCTCSFLEIYNEQITDLLEPSLTNLHLREDLKKGVYVENLTEVSVSSVNDVLKVLLQGAANRKMAATHMNSESSRSHSVFTCNIESCWEKDSMKHLRFGRLNLVDLAGSERQKSSGADGDRLKEAANINKSLSTLGLVIMSLVDLAHGKHRHVPYRDSRLTFLLQDSLGGNSKTTIIANVSPSSCSANETLSTLKFAQRAKLIQNNAKVNEDASGDVSILQQQIQLLKGQLSFLMNHHSSSHNISHPMPSMDQSSSGYLLERFGDGDDDHRTNGRNNKIENLKATLLGALRREKLADMEVRRLEAEIEQMNRIVCQQEEDSQRNKMILKFREEKIKRIGSFEDGLISADKYLINENAALREEVQLLTARIERNPELARLVLENNRLLRKLRVFQNFYDHGQRERLLAEISELRDQFLELIEYRGKHRRLQHASREKYQVGSLLEESELVKSKPNPMPVDDEDFVDKSNQQMGNNLILDYNDMKKELMELRSLMEVMELEQVNLIEEIEILKEENCRLLEQLDKNERVGKQPGSFSDSCESKDYLKYTNLNLVSRGDADISLDRLQSKLEHLSKDLEEARLVNSKCVEEYALEMTMKRQSESVCEEVEMETTKTILFLQEEISQIKSEFQERLCTMAEEITSLKDTLAAKEEEMKAVCTDWEKATLDLTNFLTDGSKSLEDAAWQIESIACSFPNVDHFVGECVERAVKTCIEKEETILLLKKSLEEAQQTVSQMDEKLISLKGATIALAEGQQQVINACSEEGIQLATGLIDKASNIAYLENNEVAMNSISGLPELTHVATRDQTLTSGQNFGWINSNNEIELAKQEVLKLENVIKTSCHDAEELFSVIKSDGHSSVSFFKELIHEIVNDIHELQRQYNGLKEKGGRIQSLTVGIESSNSSEIHGNDDSLCEILHKILCELIGTNDSLNHIRGRFCKILDAYAYLGAAEESMNSDGSTDCSTSSSYLSDESDGSILSSDARESNIAPNLIMNLSEEETLCFLRKEFRITYTKFGKLKAQFDKIFCEKDMKNYLCSNPCFSNSLDLLESNDQCLMRNDSEVTMPEKVPGLGVVVDEAETGYSLGRELKWNEKTTQASRFFNKFEEAYRTVKEADDTLQELTKANESAKELTSSWKQAGAELMVEKARLAEEIRLINSDVNGRDSKYELLQNQMHHDFTEFASSISSIEDTFRETQKYVDALCNSALFDAIGMVKETMSWICESRLLLEEIFTNMVGNDVASFIIHECQKGALIQKFGNHSRNLVFPPAALHEHFLALRGLGENYQICVDDKLGSEDQEKYKVESIKKSGSEERDMVHANLMDENADLRRELEHKEALLKGLLFDFSLLQESASNKKDVKDEIDKLIAALSQVESELRIKNYQHEDMIVQHRSLQNQLKEAQSALFASRSDLVEERIKLENLSKENAKLRELLGYLYLSKSETEEELREQRQAVETLEKEIILLTSSAENQATGEKIQLLDQVRSLQDKLDIAYALANENEAIAVEARQESEASKIYAEQKEEEVKILEHSVEELESTINILEKKVHETEREVERHHMIRDSLELELQALKERLEAVANFTENLELKNSGSLHTDDPFQRSLSHESHQKADGQIRILEVEKAELVKEVKRYKEYISELLLHAEAQASQFQHKYKDLEVMVREFRTDSLNSENQVLMPDKTEKVSTRTRGSSSPFRCISSLVQQMNLEKDQELSAAKLRIEELEASAAEWQKEVCIMKNRLAAAENMTHDVIRDLLGVKLDMTSYADLIDQHQLQNFILEAHQQSLEYSAMEKEVLNLRKKLNDLIEEREAFISQMKRREAAELAAQMTIQQLQERDQLLTAQNEMLKVDKSNLRSKVVELDEMVKNLSGTQSNQLQNQKHSGSTLRLSNSNKLVLGLNDKFPRQCNTK